MTKGNKKIKNNTKLAIESKESYKYFDEYHDLFSGRLSPISEPTLLQLGLHFVKYALENPKIALDANNYWRMMGISCSVIAKWRKRSEPFNELYIEALDQIGWNREHGAMVGWTKADGSFDRRLSEGLVKYTLPLYRKEHKDIVEWLAKLKTHDINDGAMPLYIKEMFYCGNCSCDNCKERKEIFKKKE